MELTSAPLSRLQPNPTTEATLAPESPPMTSQSRLLLPALLFGGLCWASFFPLNQGYLAWLALVPLTWLVFARASLVRVYASAYLGGLVLFLPALQWLRVAHPMMFLAWLGLTLYCAFYVVLAVGLTRRLVQRSPLPVYLVLPSVWVGLEYLRGSLLGGFAWYFLAHAQHDALRLIQVVDLTGTYGLSWVIAFVGTLLGVFTLQIAGLRRWLRIPETAVGLGRKTQLGWTIAALGLLAAIVAYGTIRLDHPPFASGPQLALIQGDIPQDIRNSRNSPDRERAVDAILNMKQHHDVLTQKALATPPNPDLVVWPETSYPDPYYLRPNQRPAEFPAYTWRQLLKYEAELTEEFRWRGQQRTAVLLGLNTQQIMPDGDDRKYNTALLIQPDGRIGGIYHKMHRVPFGEYIPFEKTLPFMKMFSPYDHDYGIAAGEDYARLPLRSGDQTYHFGVLICYEDTDPTLARRYVGDNTGESVDFLVNISNDGWFKRTEEHEQHLAIARFRAVEARRALARAVNIGISALIDSDGRVIALPAASWHASKQQTAVVKAEVPIDQRSSLYARWGDWFPAGCGLIVFFGLVGSFRGRRS